MDARTIKTAIRRRVAPFFLAAGMTAVLTQCHADAIVAPPTQVAFGTWGGDQAGLIATAASTEITFQCTSGVFAGGLALDANGRFSVAGNYEPYGGRFNEPPFAAELSGQVTGNTLTFAIAVNDTVHNKLISLGPATVVFGRTPDIIACPVL